MPSMVPSFGATLAVQLASVTPAAPGMLITTMPGLPGM